MLPLLHLCRLTLRPVYLCTVPRVGPGVPPSAHGERILAAAGHDGGTELLNYRSAAGNDLRITLYVLLPCATAQPVGHRVCMCWGAIV